MKKLEKLRFEQRVAKILTMLPIQMQKVIEGYYKREVAQIEEYNGDNPEVSPESLSELEKIMEEVYHGSKEAK